MDKKITDSALFNRVKEGDEAAFEEVFRLYYPQLSLFANRYVKDLEIAEEITQDLFCTLWEKRETIELTTALKSYLYSAIHNNCLRYFKHQKVRDKYQVEVQSSHNEFDNAEVSNQLEAFELEQKIQKGINSLPEQRQKIFKLSRFEGMRYKEIATHLGLSVKTVEVQMSKALKFLRQELKEYLPNALVLVFALIGLGLIYFSVSIY